MYIRIKSSEFVITETTRLAKGNQNWAAYVIFWNTIDSYTWVLITVFCYYYFLDRHFFAIPTNPGEQFFTFTCLAAWLLTCCGRNFEQPQEVCVDGVTEGMLDWKLQQTGIKSRRHKNIKKVINKKGIMYNHIIEVFLLLVHLGTEKQESPKKKLLSRSMGLGKSRSSFLAIPPIES